MGVAWATFFMISRSPDSVRPKSGRLLPTFILEHPFFSDNLQHFVFSSGLACGDVDPCVQCLLVVLWFQDVLY